MAGQRSAGDSFACHLPVQSPVNRGEISIFPFWQHRFDSDRLFKMFKISGEV